MSVSTYDAAQVIVTVGGIDLSGFADGTFISVARDEQTWQKVSGADGFITRSKTNNRSGTLTLTLQQTSPSNQVLSDFANQDELSNDGVFEVQIKDLSGESRLFSGIGWVQGLPSIDYAKESSDRAWVIDLAQIEYVIAGNAVIGGSEG